MRVTNVYDNELRRLEEENIRLKRELEKARLKAENERIQKEINELENPFFPYTPMPSPYRWPDIIYCNNIK